MNRYIQIRRLRGPAFLLLVGVLALFHQMGVIGHFWHLFWPLFLIMLGVFMLAERAALAGGGGYPPGPYSGGPCAGPYPVGQPYPGAPYAGAPTVGGPDAAVAEARWQDPAEPGSSIVPAPMHDLAKDPEGGQS